MVNASSFAITIEGGARSTLKGCLQVRCRWECRGSMARVTQIQVGTDGLAVVVAKNGRAHDCLTSPEVGGLTLAMLHWMFTSWSNAQLQDFGLDLASVIPDDDGDGVKEWSDLNRNCPEVPINTYGPGSDSGTYDFFGEATLCKSCFSGTEGYEAEGFPYCPSDKHNALEQLTADGDIAAYIQSQRPVNCYMHSESDYQLYQWLSADTGGIAYFGYAYYATFAGQLTVARIASDAYKGVKDTADAKVEPSTYTITDGSYSVYKRELFMNVDNEAWDRVHPYLSYGFSPAGQSLVASVGYVRVNAALLAKMKIRIEERGNEEADYVSVAPSNCAIGTELSSVPYVNQLPGTHVMAPGHMDPNNVSSCLVRVLGTETQIHQRHPLPRFGNNKINYTCARCQPGTFKFLDTPTACTRCEAGRFSDQDGRVGGDGEEEKGNPPTKFAEVGQSTCGLCDVGYEAVNGTSCRACEPGFYKSEAAAAACSPCAAGRFNNQSAQADCGYCSPGFFAPEGSTRCTACPLNEIAAVPGSATCSYCGEGFTTTQVGSTSCRRCRAGSYRSTEPQCVQCPEPKTTAFQGAVLRGDCVCPAGQYLRDGLTGDSVEAMASGSCTECGEGLNCPVGSDLRIYAGFLAGQELMPEDQRFPLLEEGYFATAQEPTQVYKCGSSSHCPGGLPGTCAPGRIGIPCGRCQADSESPHVNPLTTYEGTSGLCEAGMKFENGACTECKMDSVPFFVGAVVAAIVIPVFYYFMNSPVTAKASTMLSTTMAFGMTLTLLQTIGLVGLVSLSWPSYLQPFLDFVSIFMLDLESLNFDCVGVSSAMRYVTSVLCWPAALTWLVICGLLSKLGPAKLHFVKSKALSTLGQLFQIGFTIIAKTALMPFMCYSHPNGKSSSVLRFSDVMCWEEQTGHTIMVIFGVMMTGIMLIYWATLLWCTVQAPKRSAKADFFFLQATRFLFFRFRTDYWWYGTWFILRGPLLSLPVVIFTDLPQVQLFIMTAVLETYMVVQLMTWPWKTPLINLADGAMSMMMILLLSIGAAFLDGRISK
ncbi:sphX [Symbiodinium natans]|uniref:SphX protein n=1 Tax=Symbiodinium natans TaxID=878477 RepID=A0A812HU75_9DINO|nr:sphX [Symbiodinium natans]